MLKLTKNILLEHDVIKEINISDDGKKYINDCTLNHRIWRK